MTLVLTVENTNRLALVRPMFGDDVAVAVTNPLDAPPPHLRLNWPVCRPTRLTNAAKSLLPDAPPPMRQ